MHTSSAMYMLPVGMQSVRWVISSGNEEPSVHTLCAIRQAGLLGGASPKMSLHTQLVTVPVGKLTVLPASLAAEPANSQSSRVLKAPEARAACAVA